jgi:hypothetical protein
LAEAKKSKLIIDVVSGEEIDKHVGNIMNTPSGAKEMLGFLVRKKRK